MHGVGVLLSREGEREVGIWKGGHRQSISSWMFVFDFACRDLPVVLEDTRGECFVSKGGGAARVEGLLLKLIK
jgi:hypothetical protein